MRQIAGTSTAMTRMVVGMLMATWIISWRVAATDEIVSGTFEGSAIVKLLDGDPFITRFQLTEELLFRQASGEVWVTPSNAILDGRSMPTLFVQLIGNPLESSFRKSAISYDYAVKSKYHPWRDAQRMFYDGVVTEGVARGDAKVMYLLLSASGSRWASHGPNSCFTRCHTGHKELEWRPRVDDEKLLSLVSWVRADDPSLDDIDQRANEVIIEKGPHIFGAIR